MIKVENVTKIYYPKDTLNNLKRFFTNSKVKSQIIAVSNISFEIPENQTIGLIGPNGSGKTTTIKMLTGLLIPTLGSIYIDNNIPFKLTNDFKKSIALFRGGYLSMDDGTVIQDQIEDRLMIYKQTNFNQNKFVNKIIELANIKGLLSSVPEELSQGQRHLVEFIVSVLHQPKYIFLDEPMLGLDIIAIGRFKKILKFIKKQLKPTIVLTSHILQQVVDLSDRIILINHGVVVLDDSPDNIINQNTFDRQIKLHLISHKGTGSLPANIKVKFPWATIQTTKKLLEKDINLSMEQFEFDDIRILDPPIDQIFEKFYL